MYQNTFGMVESVNSAFSLFFAVSDSTSQSEVNKHLEMGRDLLGRGQLQDALSHYHAAVGESDVVSKQYHAQKKGY
jgi:hypothetical protein